MTSFQVNQIRRATSSDAGEVRIAGAVGAVAADEVETAVEIVLASLAQRHLSFPARKGLLKRKGGQKRIQGLAFRVQGGRRV